VNDRTPCPTAGRLHRTLRSERFGRDGSSDSAALQNAIGSEPTTHLQLGMALQPLLTVEQVAACLAVSPKTVRRMAARQRIPCVRFGRALRFLPGDLLAWLSARREG